LARRHRLAAGVASVPLVLLPATVLAAAICTRAGLRVWWQVPAGAAIILAGATVVALLSAVTGVSSASAPSAVGGAAITTAVLLLPLGVYWCALQSTDWLLSTAARWLGTLWPSRFGSLARPVETPARLRRGAARFRVREHFTYAEGLSTMVVISGEVVDGTVRHGMRACAAAGSRTLTATIQSIEPVESLRCDPPCIGLLLAVHESDLGTWKATAREGAVIGIVE
jgi:hypothetical protein